MSVLFYIYLKQIRQFIKLFFLLNCFFFFRSQDDGRRRIFCIVGLPYFIKLSNIVIKQDEDDLSFLFCLCDPADKDEESQTHQRDPNGNGRILIALLILTMGRTSYIERL